MNSISTTNAGGPPEQGNGFYVEGLYYQTLRARTVRGYHDDGSLFEYVVPAGHYFVCATVEARPFTEPALTSMSGGFVTLLTTLPGDERPLRHTFWTGAQPNEGFDRIDNPMEIIAIAAATGLTL